MHENIKTITPIKVVSKDTFKPELRKKKVAAYARVSTDYEDQLNSYKVQCDEYTTRITSNPNYIFSGLFADQGLSGTQAKKRPEFMKMIEAARNGDIDLIITKSISRFGRNTVDVISYIRELRTLNVEIFFEKENISSLDPKIDFMLTILSSIAQEESHSISSNVKWAIEKKAKKGIVDPRRIFGYDVVDSKYVINESESKIIKEIFNLALIGYNINDIVKTLNNQGYQTLKGSTFKYGTVRHILQNERYAGDALLRKTVCIDYLTKKTVKNDNIVDKYYVSNNHEGIITKEQFQNVQNILNSNKNKSKTLSKTSKYPLTGILYCPKCGRTLKRQHIKSGSSMYVVLNCNHSYNNDFTCKTTSPRYDLVMGAVIDAVNLLSTDEALLNSIIDTFDSESHLNALRFSLEMLQDEVTNLHQKLNENYETSIVEEIKSKENTIADLSNHISIEASALIRLEYLKSLNDYSVLKSNINFKDILSIVLATNQKVKLIIAPRKTLDDLTNDISKLLDLEPIVSKMHLSEDETRGIFYEVALYE